MLNLKSRISILNLFPNFKFLTARNPNVKKVNLCLNTLAFARDLNIGSYCLENKIEGIYLQERKSNKKKEIIIT